MLNFESDYIQGAHEEILRRLVETNMEPLTGYGNDKYCDAAKEKIKAACGRSDAEVFLLVGGTQTNQLVIDRMLEPYEGVISATTGHVSAHEAGAIEYTGHEVLTVPHKDGKISAESIRHFAKLFYTDEARDHLVFPGLVYISHPTEYGTLYTKSELLAIREACDEYGMGLYLDGARLGYGLMSTGTDVTLKDIAQICDAFYIGGTKVGALCGEAVVFTHGNAPKHFFTSMKQHGALLAKGRLLGVQFDTLFTDDLYFKISRHAIEMADRIRAVLVEKGYKFLIETTTNQMFIILENEQLKKLRESVSVCFWEIVDDTHTAVRIATSWATSEDDVNTLCSIL